MEESVYFQSCPQKPGNEGRDPVSHMVNYRDAVFRVTPKLNFEFHNDFKDTKKKFEMLRTTYQDKEYIHEMEK